MKKTIVFERDKCIGCGTCAVICSSFWEMREDGRAGLKESANKGKEREEREIEDANCNEEAAQSCPVQCIRIVSNS